MRPPGTVPSTRALPNSFPTMTNGALVDALVSGLLLPPSGPITSALRDTDRAYFAPQHPYINAATPIPGHPTSFVTAPTEAATVLYTLGSRLRQSAMVLDVGAGSGYLTAVFARLVGPSGFVVGVEACHALVAVAEASVFSAAAGEPQNVRILQGDGHFGAPAYAPFDAIYVGAAAAEVPHPLVEQLAIGGRLLVAVGPVDGEQILTVVDKGPDGSCAMVDVEHVRYKSELRPIE